MTRELTTYQKEFMAVIELYGGEIVDNGNVMHETDWERPRVAAVGRGLVRRGLLTYTPILGVGFEGGVWSVVKKSQNQ